MNERAGTVTLPKDLNDYEFLNREPLCRKAAALDLWFLANDRLRVVRVNGRAVTLKRGQLGWSQESLAKRWRWSREKVARFLVELQDERLILFEASRTVTIITVMDYTVYNDDSSVRTATDNAADQTTDPTTEPASDQATEPAQKWEVGSGKKEEGKGEGARARANGHFPEIEIPGLEEFLAACSNRGIPTWFAEQEHAWRSERPADRWPLGANWQTAVTSAFVRWRGQGAPMEPGGRFVMDKKKASVWELQQQLEALRTRRLEHPANEESAAWTGETTEEERKELQEISGKIGELEKQLSQAK